MECTHDAADQDTAAHFDGLCPLCLQAENARLREIVNAPLSPVELRLVDKNCGWVAFKHAWNAVMKRRQETVGNQP